MVASCVAVVAIVGTALSGSGGTAGSEPGVATQPTPSASPSPELRHHVLSWAVAPVSVDAPGWQCSEPADEKFSCSKGAASVVVNWRPAGERKYYLDPGKADVVEGVHTYVSEAHPPFFATVAPIGGTTQAEVDEVGAALVWAR